MEMTAMLEGTCDALGARMFVVQRLHDCGGSLCDCNPKGGGAMHELIDLTAAVADIHNRLVRLHDLDQRELELLCRVVEALKALRRDLDTLEHLVS
jgi:hypothetical protein